MARENLLEIRITGENISPEVVRVKELGELLGSVEDMLASTMIQKFPDLNRDDIVIGLVDIEEGSARYQFQAQHPEIAEIAFITIGNAISENQYLNLPGLTVKALEKFSAFAQRHNVNAEFRAVNGETRVLAVITPETKIPPVPLITGKTAIFARIVRVGGKEPKVMVETPGGDTIYCDVQEKLAKELSPYLYSWVGLEGTARWNARDNTLHSFRIEKVTSYKGETTSQSLGQLSGMVSEYLRDVSDVRGFVHKLREM